MEHEFQPIWVAGFMSGTSLDGVDGAMLLTDGEKITQFGAVTELEYTAAERQILADATDAARHWNWLGDMPEQIFEQARQVINETHHRAWQNLLAAHNTSTDGQNASVRPTLVGVHGQTVLHRRPAKGRRGATLQLMDGIGFAAKLGCRVAYDFRVDDVAVGGEGAPLAPVYHRALLEQLGPAPAVVLNLGGVANITARQSDGQLLAFDTGPANGPIDEWVQGHGRGNCDYGGRFAAAGRVHDGLLAQLLEHPWFFEAAPKSLDRYDFNASMARGLSFEDGAATLTAFSAHAVAAGLRMLDEPPSRVIVCGGGRHNPVLMQMLTALLPCPVQTAEDVGWRGNSIEAEAFAFLAVRSLRGLAMSWPQTTGAPRPLSGGRLVSPD
ncbi:MAG: anhydro-N-acetylmuramic acid kinase [Hyphomonadaceae bacterium]|nr:anhydro-N-acetylmuramic acid kinase [Hyphomonadaceae bacterium]OUX93655.1 MAG: anhydro-N-acetylmuramic acid kinase [Hyphomonas sp. TMED17]CAI8323271.1 MAG: Anhydro-N-acetylmuramic acid kinase [Hyphomonas sp. TMED17]